MGFLGLGTKIKEPKKLVDYEKDDKEIFALTEEELSLGKSTIKNLEEARKLIIHGLSNTEDLVELAKKGLPPRHHDFDFEDVAGEYQESSRFLTKARNASIGFSNDVKTLTEHLFQAEDLLKKNFEKVGHKSYEDVEIFKNTEYIAVSEVPPLDKHMNHLIDFIDRTIVPLLKDFADEETFADEEIKKIRTLSEELKKQTTALNERAERFEKVLHNVNKRMKKLHFMDAVLEKEVLQHLKNARREIKEVHHYEGGYDR